MPLSTKSATPVALFHDGRICQITVNEILELDTAPVPNEATHLCRTQFDCWKQINVKDEG